MVGRGRSDGGIGGGFLDVEAGGEGFVAGAGEDDGAGGGVGGEKREEGRELVPHSVFVFGLVVSAGGKVGGSLRAGRGKRSNRLTLL